MLYYPNQIDEATQERTERFFRIVIIASDEELLALVNEGIDIKARNNFGDTALMEAAWNGHTKTVLALLKAGAEIEARDNHGNTALMRAAWNGHTKTVLALLERGANVNAKNNFGNAAEDFRGIIRSQEAIDKIAKWREEYEEFRLNGNPPASAEDLYHLLAVYPLTDPKAKVDTIKHIRKICDHANWQSEEQLSGILNILKENGTFGPEPTVATTTIQTILDANIPPQHQVNSLSNQPSAARMGK